LKLTAEASWQHMAFSLLSS